MDLFMKAYRDACKKEFGPYGFKRTNNNHWRVVNDVYQAFHLRRTPMGWNSSCQMAFGTIPLCYGIKAHYVQQESLLMFQPYFFPDYEKVLWYYNTKKEETIQPCVTEIIGFIRQFLIPYFEQGNDCASAYEENRKIHAYLLQRKKIVDFDEHGFLGWYPEFCMALKNGAYSLAEEYLATSINSTKQHLLDIEKEDPPRGESYVDRLLASIAEDTHMLERISARDETFIRDWIEGNERKSRIALGLSKPLL